MGGCRCVYRSCPNATTQSRDLHYFHFPVRDVARCEQWITNARKPSFRTLDKRKLRNKVVCSVHFEKKCFINKNHDRLTHTAVPTLGFEEDDDENNKVSTQNTASLGATDNIDIMLIPLNEDNTKFTLPDAGFSGMSYTLCNDTLVPSNKVNYMYKPNMRRAMTRSDARVTNVKPVIKRIKTSFPLKQAFTISSAPISEAQKRRATSKPTIFAKSLHPYPEHVGSDTNNGTNISTYSVSTVNGDLSLQPSTDTDMSNLNIEKLMGTYHADSSSMISENHVPLLENISLHLKSDNEYTISVVPPTLPSQPKGDNFMNADDTSQESAKNSAPQDMVVEEESVPVNENTFGVTPEKEYIRVIQNHSKQIRQLKSLLQKQSKINKYILQRKITPTAKQRKLTKMELLELLEPLLKPSLVAILKFELLPLEDVVLSDKEEQFITELYTENTECYNLLKNKWKWNIPSTDKSEEQKTE